MSDSTQIEGFEGAGVGRKVELREGKELEVGEIVKRVKEHLGLEHGMSSWQSQCFLRSPSMLTVSATCWT